MSIENDKLYYFCNQYLTVKDIKGLLDQYSIDDIQIFIQTGEFTPELYVVLQPYFLERILG